jgi:glucokinase
MPTDARQGPAAVLATLERLIARLLDAARPARVAGIGIAAAGQIHPETQAVVQAPNLGWHDVPLRAHVRDRFALPTHVENDVRAAAWGEYRHGAGRGAGSLVAVFVGTGVGSGAVVDGRLLRGAGNAAGELGHTQVAPADGAPCGCGQRGCLEAYASGSGLIRRVLAALERGATTSLLPAAGGDPGRVTADLVAREAAAGDALAAELWADLERYLGLALANYVTLVNPALLLLGGGVVAAVPALLDAVAAAVRARTTVMARSVRVVRPGLGDSAGLVGAAALAAEAA